jgi:hypothetical protein
MQILYRLAAFASAIVLTGALGLATASTAGASPVHRLDHAASALTASAAELYNVNSHLCLTTPGGVDNSNTIQYTCNENPAQMWHQGACLPHGQFCHYVNGNGDCLGVADGGGKAGDHVVAWACGTTSNKSQYWYAGSVACGPSPATCTYFENYNFNAQGYALALAIEGASTAKDAYGIVSVLSTLDPSEDWA